MRYAGNVPGGRSIPSMIVSNPRILVLILMHFCSASYLVIPTLHNNLASEPYT